MQCEGAVAEGFTLVLLDMFYDADIYIMQDHHNTSLLRYAKRYKYHTTSESLISFCLR